MPSERHQQLIKDFLAENVGWKTSGLRKELNKSLYKLYKEDDTVEPEDRMSYEEFVDLVGMDALSYIPDAFKVDTENKTVHLLEVDGHSRMSKRKAHAIDPLWWFLDCEEWFATLTVIDVSTGGKYTLDDADICDYLYREVYRKKWGIKND